MYAWTNLIIFIAQTLDGLLTLYLYVVIISALMTWIEPNPYNPIVRFIYSITEPVFEWFREHLPVIFGGIDFSPLIVILVIQLFQRVVIPSAVHALIPRLHVSRGGNGNPPAADSPWMRVSHRRGDVRGDRTPGRVAPRRHRRDWRAARDRRQFTRPKKAKRTTN